MVIRLISVSDHMPLPELHAVFRAILGWNGDLGYIIRVHGQEVTSFRRKSRSKALDEFKLHRQEKILYVSDTLHIWEWDVRDLDIQVGIDGDPRLPDALQVFFELLQNLPWEDHTHIITASRTWPKRLQDEFGRAMKRLARVSKRNHGIELRF
jgi:hypothetical protein